MDFTTEFPMFKAAAAPSRMPPKVLCDYFNQGNWRWADSTSTRALLDRFSSEDTALFPSLTVLVSNPSAMLDMLDSLSGALVTDLIIGVSSKYTNADKLKEWCALFERLSREASNVKELRVHWDVRGPWGDPLPWNEDTCKSRYIRFGYGQSVKFVQALALLKIKGSVTISGCYALAWPRYLKEKMGVEVKTHNGADVPWSVIKQNYRAKQDYQMLTEPINPWKDTIDVNVFYLKQEKALYLISENLTEAYVRWNDALQKTSISKPAYLQAQSAASGEHPQMANNENDAMYRCVCGDQREISGREMIMCDRCEVWQHNKCLSLSNSRDLEDETYLCEVCAPQDHQELLVALARSGKLSPFVKIQYYEDW